MELGFYVVCLSYDSVDELPATGYLTVQEGDIVNVLAPEIERGEPNGPYPGWWYCYAMLPPAHRLWLVLHGWVPVQVLGPRVTPVNYDGLVPNVSMFGTPFQDTESGFVPNAEEEPDDLGELYVAN